MCISWWIKNCDNIKMHGMTGGGGLVYLILFSSLAAMHSACLELACTKQINSGTRSAVICFSKTIFDLVLEANNFVFQRDSKPWQLSGVVSYQRLWSYLYNWIVSEYPFFMSLQTRRVGGCFSQSTDTCGYWRRDCLSRTRVAGQFRLPVAIRLVSSEIFLCSRS